MSGVLVVGGMNLYGAALALLAGLIYGELLLVLAKRQDGQHDT